MEKANEYFAANKHLWNQRTTVHKDSAFYDLEGFKKGANVLTPIELNEIGDVYGGSLLHLQCHFGMDTLSFSRMGAKCTGVDLSNDAIQLAMAYKRNGSKDTNGVFFKSKKIKKEKRQQNFVTVFLRKQGVISYVYIPKLFQLQLIFYQCIILICFFILIKFFAMKIILLYPYYFV